MADIEVRQAKNDEIHIALELLKQAAEWLQNKNISYWQSWLKPQKAYVNWVQEGFNNNEFYFVYVKNELAGMFRLQWSDDIFWGTQENNAGYVHSFTTLRKYQGKGIGIKILKYIEQLCIEKGKSYLRLDCGYHLTALCNYYKNFGFKTVGKTMTMGEDLVLLEKQLIFDFNYLQFKLTQTKHLEQICQIEQNNSEFIQLYTQDRHNQAIESTVEQHLSVFNTKNNKLIGFIILAGLKTSDKKIEFRRIVLCEKGKGFGKLCLEFVKQYCFDHLNASQIWLDVYAHNHRAIHTYNSQGFKTERTIHDYDSKGNLIIMRYTQ